MTDTAHKNLPRLYVPFTPGENPVLSEGQRHYLKNVMRVKEGDLLHVFNGHDGEWLARVSEISKKNVLVSIVNKLHEQKPSPDIWVLASLVKKEAFELMVEKASELGVSRFIPVISDHTVVHRMNKDRAQAIAVEAAEQCERMDIMAVYEPAPLKNVLNTWSNKRKLMFCMERCEAVSIAKAAGELTDPVAVLIGPEGGFSGTEMSLVTALDFVRPVSLGPFVLKAETAMIAALACLVVSRP